MTRSEMVTLAVTVIEDESGITVIECYGSMVQGEPLEDLIDTVARLDATRLKRIALSLDICDVDPEAVGVIMGLSTLVNDHGGALVVCGLSSDLRAAIGNIADLESSIRFYPDEATGLTSLRSMA